MLVKTAFPINWGHKEEVVEGAAAANDVDIRVAAKLEVSGYKGGCVHIWIFVPIRFFGPDLSSLILALCRYRVWSNTTYYIAAEDMQRWLNMYLGHWNNQCSLLNVTDLIFHKLFTSIWHQVISWREMYRSVGVVGTTETVTFLQSGVFSPSLMSTHTGLQRPHKPDNSQISGLLSR